MTDYKLGLTLMILGWLACLNPYWILFAGPVFLIGLLYVWISKTNLKQRILTTLIPLLLYLPGVYAFEQLISKHKTPETFLIPRNFRGQITLIYNEPCGQIIPKINGRLVYRIPENGVMIIKNEIETGIVDQEYYFVDDQWNKVAKIPWLIQQDFNEEYTLEKNKNEPPRNKVGVFLLESGGGDSPRNKNFKCHTMDVNSWDSLRAEKTDGGLHDYADSLLFDCRHKK